MKIVKWVLLALVAVIVIGLLVVYFRLNSIVKSQVETQASHQLNVPTSLGSANVNLFGGDVSLKDLQIGSPPGFTADKMFTLGGIDVNTSLGELREQPVKISEIIINKPKLVIEQKDLKTNIQALMDQLPKSDAPPDAEGKPSEPLKMIIGLLQLRDAQVVIRPGFGGMDKEYSMTIPSVTVRDIGTGEGNKNGAAVKEVVGKAIEGLVKAASEQGNLPEALKLALQGDFDQIAKKLGEDVKREAAKIQQDVQKKVGSEIDKVLGGKDGKNPTTQDIGDRAKEGLQNILGGKKDEKK